MATATERRYTPEDLLEIRDRPMPELVDGQLVERPTMGHEADQIAVTLIFWLVAFCREHRLGSVRGAHGSYQIFPDDPGKVRAPDVSFIRRGREPAGPAKGHSRVVPDLVAEVISPNDLAEDLESKTEDYLRAGIPRIWVVNPVTQTVRVIRGDGSGTYLRVGDTLEGEDILPGFRLALADLFQPMA